ncbi:pirin family protein [Catenovulum sediminis]|uniref:Pirin family protein n=1 Tax=Catenovulum sediminis TaxID=1740262 RepID=A0ABV1RI29_9ALTE|nr:pirin family protein [Catenovulum sediminis]
MRTIVEKIVARATSDGAGVKLSRVFGGRQTERFDPFLMLDEFGSEQADDYIAGFPPHPHRGFETITYMLQGKMEHQDHMGNIGLLQDGGLQWMTAGKGVIHSEMPKQTEGRLHGFQLWLNLASKDKLQPARYQDIHAHDIPMYKFDGLQITALAGQANVNAASISGAVQKATTEPIYFDFSVDKTQVIEIDIPENFTALIYVYAGRVQIGEVVVNQQELVRLSKTGQLSLEAPQNSGFLLIAGKPLNEPIAQYGPFVMNSQSEIDIAIKDYQNGVLTD